jgi:hypothetical protein
MSEKIIKMKTYHELRNEIKCNDASLNQIKLYVVLTQLLRLLFTETFITLFSMLPFFLFYWLVFGISIKTMWVAGIYLISHFLFYEFYLKNSYKKKLKADYEEIMLIVLKDLRNEKRQKTTK